MTVFLLTISLIALNLTGNVHMTAAGVLAAYAVIAFGCISSTALFMTVVPLFKTSSACGAFFGILSAVSGFVIGAYIPISAFSDKVQTVCNIFPGSHITILLRNVLLGGVLNHIDESIGGLDNGAFVNAIKDIFTFNAKMFGNGMEVSGMVLYITAMIIASMFLMTVLYSKRYKK